MEEVPDFRKNLKKEGRKNTFSTTDSRYFRIGDDTRRTTKQNNYVFMSIYAALIPTVPKYEKIILHSEKNFVGHPRKYGKPLLFWIF